MAIRTALLNGNNISRDTDFSKYIESVSEPGVIEGLTVSSSQVAIGKARVPCERTGGETIYALVSVTTPVSISGNGDVYISVSQTYIDDGELANEDGTGIATISVGTMPAKNALKLATKSGSTITDARNMIAKVGELKTYIQSLQSRMNIVEQEIDELIADSATDCLEEAGLVGEKYNLSDSLFRQITPAFSNASIDWNVGDIASNTQIHIQRLGSGTASNKLKLKAKKIGAPTTGLVVEVRRGVQVDVSDSEAYWYGSELVCSGSIPYSSFTTDYQEFEVTLNGQFGGTKGELLDIVVYQTSNIVNSTNYYALACDSTQYSEGFSLVAVNGSTRTRSKYMPYCIGTGLAEKMLCKTATAGSGTSTSLSFDRRSSDGNQVVSYTTTQTYTKMYIVASWRLNNEQYYGNEGASITVKVGNTTVISKGIAKNESGSVQTVVNNVSSGTVIQATIVPPSRGGNAGAYWENRIRGTIAISANQSGMIRPLIATEEKTIGQQASATSYGRLPNGERYGEFDEENYSSATTGSISLGNCVGFKIITDSSGEQYKIPIYGV